MAVALTRTVPTAIPPNGLLHSGSVAYAPTPSPSTATTWPVYDSRGGYASGAVPCVPEHSPYHVARMRPPKVPLSIRVPVDGMAVDGHSPSVVSRTVAQAPIVSKSGMIVVLDYSPTEGESRVPIMVNVQLRAGPELVGEAQRHAAFDSSAEPDIKLRIVIGRTALPTTIRELPVPAPDTELYRNAPKLHRLRVCAYAPPLSDVRFPDSLCVPLTIQVMVGQTDVFESLSFGTFTYWEPGES